LLTFGVESPLLREEIAATLRRKGFFVDRSFASEIIRMPAEWLVEFLDEIVDDKTKEDVRTALVSDKQLPDTRAVGRNRFIAPSGEQASPPMRWAVRGRNGAIK